MHPLCSIQLLGGLSVQQGERLLTRFRTHKTGALLAYLAYHRGQCLRREVVIEAIWPEVEDKTGRNNLSIALSSLRHQLEPPGVPRGAILQADRFTLGLNASLVTTDVTAFEASLRTAEAATNAAQQRQALQHALDCYQGELLPGFYEEWVLQEQHRLHLLYEQALETFQNLAPSPEAPPGIVPASLAAPKPVPPEPSAHLPLQLTRFFGREEELARLQTLLRAGDAVRQTTEPLARLVTITGPAGTGKTRLSIEAASALSESYAGAVWFVPLAALSDARLIPSAIVAALGLARSPQQEPLEQVVERLSQQPSLLLLDNLEHLLDPDRRKSEDGAAVVRVLLEQVPNLRCLVTSRQGLALEGEREVLLLPLSVPEPDEPAEQMLQHASVQLFVDRAQAVRADFQVTQRNRVAVVALCRRLEGIPLAIELAAARAKVLTPSQMLSQLERRFDFLVSRRRDALERHRTLKSAIEWSYRLLSPELQRFFVRLSVFRGGWSVEAAEVVCEEALALEYLEALQEGSLVLAEERATGEMRFRMLETLREYAWEQLTSEERAAVQQRHLDYFLALAEEAEPHLRSSKPATWLDRLETEHDNLRTALSWSGQDTDSADTGLRLAGALVRFWDIRGYYNEGREHLQATLSHGAKSQTPARAKTLNGAGVLAYDQGDYAAARTLHEESLAISREIGDKQDIAYSLNGLGNVAFVQGDYAAARMHYEESLAIRRELGDKRSIAGSLNNLGNVASRERDFATVRMLYEQSLAISRELGDKIGIATTLLNLGNVTRGQGDYAAARALYEQSLAIRRELGDKQGISTSLINLGEVIKGQGDYAAARALFEESLAIQTELGDKYLMAFSLLNLGNVARGQGDYAAARALYEQSLAIRRELGDKLGTARALSHLGNVAQSQGDYATARAFYEQSLAIFKELGARDDIVDILDAMSELTAGQEQTERAARLWAATQALREAIGTPKPPDELEAYEREVQATREALGDSAFEAAWAEGHAMTMEQAIAYALEEE